MKPFIPHTLPIEDIDYQRLFPLIANAAAELARYNALLQAIPNPAVMLSPYANHDLRRKNHPEFCGA